MDELGSMGTAISWEGQREFLQKVHCIGDYFSKNMQKVPCPLPLQLTVSVSTNLPLSSTLTYCQDSKQ